ncbi:arginyltransferase [Sulfurimonas sp. MAG313]|nr:arginyltransferase [Sulfurimonas sp. MAG313]
MNLVHESVGEDKCSYLDDAKQNTHYKIIKDCSLLDCESLIERGWRRFGTMFFRPVCVECTACESFKIDVRNYQFSKSQRRILRKNKDTKIVIQRPQVTFEHLKLFEKYHLHMKDKRDWKYEQTDARHYYTSFVSGYGDFGYEILYYIEDELVGVDLVDILPHGISSIYFYYNPSFEKQSLGTFSMLQQIQIAQDNDLEWIYMGYYVKGCQSLAYKSRYTPYHILQGRPPDTLEPSWVAT